MVTKFESLLKRIEDQMGNVILFTTLRMDEFVDQWSIIISAKWVANEKEDRTKQFKEIVSLVNAIFTEQESLSIARIGLFPQESHVPMLFSNYKSGSEIDDTKINGFQVHEALVIKSNFNKKKKSFKRVT